MDYHPGNMSHDKDYIVLILLALSNPNRFLLEILFLLDHVNYMKKLHNCMRAIPLSYFITYQQ